MKDKKQKQNSFWLYGFHPVTSAITNENRKIFEIICCDESFNSLDYKVKKIISQKDIDLKIIDKKKLIKIAEEYCQKGAIHQGILAKVKPIEQPQIQDIVKQDKSIIVILDQITDPHNIGAIMRSAHLFGAKAVIATDKNSPDETGILAKSASGALDKIAYIKVTNLKRNIDILKENNYWTVGLDGDSKTNICDYKVSPKTVIIMGAEGKGMRRLTKESCDEIVYIETPNSDDIVDSLNVSNAAAIALFEISRKI
jgi:23S rRNA (guanosine2251-2'-O)-methyltransferase